MLITAGNDIYCDDSNLKVWKMVGRMDQLVKIFQLTVDTSSKLSCCFFSNEIILTKWEGGGIEVYKSDSREMT